MFEVLPRARKSRGTHECVPLARSRKIPEPTLFISHCHTKYQQQQNGGPNRSMSQLDSCTSQIVHLERKPHPPFPSLVTCSAPRRQQPKCTCSTVPNAYHPQRNTRSEVFGAFWGTTPNIDKPHHPSIHPIKAPVWFDGSELGVS
jgi:hypothetical protein